MARPVLFGIIVALGGILAGLVASVLWEAHVAGTVGAAKISLIGATLACLFVLLGILVTQPSAAASYALHCQHCGTRMYATLRSLDRTEVLTCFTCGAEWVLPAQPPRDSGALREGPRPRLAE